jgi:hypothetical protein
MAIQSGDRIVIETPAGRRWRPAVQGSVLTVLSAALVVVGPGGAFRLVIGLVGLVGLVIFGPITLALLVRAIRNKPVLILEADGFTDRTPPLGVGFVRWQEVQRIEERVFRGRVYVTVRLTDRAAFRARLPAWHRLILRLNGPMVAGDILIPDNVLSMSPAALVKTMRWLHRAAQRPAPGGGANRRA